MREGVSRPISLLVSLVVGLIVLFGLFFASGMGTSTQNIVNSTASTSANKSSSLAATSSDETNSVGPCGQATKALTVNGTSFCAEDVLNDTVIGAPGYTYFKNGSIFFMGIDFQTICPLDARGCPGANATTLTNNLLGAIQVKMTFSDHMVETASAAIGDSSYIPVLSRHTNPMAGMLIEIGSPADGNSNHVYLLVQQS